MENSADITTISYYEANAGSFVADTLDAFMSDVLGEFAALLPASAYVLDWGCGSGRDAKALSEMGFQVTAVDASPAMCQKTAQYASVPVRCESFLDLSETNVYDGIWACASLLHLKPELLPEAFARAHAALVPDGVLYASFKLGDYQGYRNGRWFTDLQPEDLDGLLRDGWTILDIWQSSDVRKERSDQKWLNFLARKAL